MKLVLCVAASFAAFAAGAEYHNALFKEWKKTHGKVYEDEEEHVIRLANFIFNHEAIEAHNAGNHTYTLGHNEFSDMTLKEFTSFYLGYNHPKQEILLQSHRHHHNDHNPHNAHQLRNHAEEVPSDGLPVAVDWEAAGALAPIKNQGQCGACWAYAAVSSLETVMKQTLGEMYVLSEQDLVDCDEGEYKNHACDGGTMDKAFEHVIAKGVCLEDDYPYTGKVGHCNTECDKSNAVVTTFHDVPSGDEAALKAAVAKTNVAVGIQANFLSFQLYESGVFTDSKKECGPTPDHGANVVGYGIAEDGMKYWKVRNSWGPTWGEDGYARLQRDVGGTGLCSVALMPSYPEILV